MWKPDGRFQAARAFRESLQSAGINVGASIVLLLDDFTDEESLDWTTYSGMSNTYTFGLAGERFSTDAFIEDTLAVLHGDPCTREPTEDPCTVYGWAIVDNGNTFLLTVKKFATAIELPAGIAFTLEPTLTFGPDS